jgi:NitT/TauT family transport system permease protein
MHGRRAVIAPIMAVTISWRRATKDHDISANRAPATNTGRTALSAAAIPIDHFVGDRFRRAFARMVRAKVTWAAYLQTAGYLAISLTLLGLLWQCVSWMIGSDVLPGPWESAIAVGRAQGEGYLWSDMSITAYRIVGAFLIALAASVAAGTILGRIRVAERIFGPWVTIGASIPSLVLIVVIYLGLGLNDHAAMIGTASIVAPAMTYAVWDGMRAINPELQEMARVFAIPKHIILRRVILPQTLPFIFTAARTGLSLTWRIMIFVELLGRSSGVGYRIQYFYNLVDMQRVVAAALPFIILMLSVEFVVLRPIERWIFRWRRAEAK